eukprot:CAMPEP_0201501888 /NCGR_PEP_ID=MMETSP0151_2-20130828/83838_1 /ASSEMBLY_ACC=CAM_ASM_000257 /TAXON_ID=200890 /ORGANISM="Paramoeba atlantica, Strain 621/1 / CCAP 1560/9" /LENGTH=168 /DNA_ID=CAMNT_0047895439 /DNA_START=834 /DNA_END=1340 /DNA_ORIENTATION=+
MEPVPVRKSARVNARKEQEKTGVQGGKRKRKEELVLPIPDGKRRKRKEELPPIIIPPKEIDILPSLEEENDTPCVILWERRRCPGCGTLVDSEKLESFANFVDLTVLCGGRKGYSSGMSISKSELSEYPSTLSFAIKRKSKISNSQYGSGPLSQQLQNFTNLLFELCN